MKFKLVSFVEHRERHKR